MEFGYWLPVFGGWLRNIPDEGMDTSWDYVKTLAQRSEDWGYSLSLIAELYLNDIKGQAAPSLDAWSTAAALAAVTEQLEIMVAVRPTFHNPAQLAKQAANIDLISNGRLSLNVVSSWWRDEATKYGIHFEQHDDRYARTKEWLDVVTNVWEKDHFTYEGKYYKVEDNILQPKPAKKPFIYAGGESEAAKTLISTQCDGYVMHGDSPESTGDRIADMRRRREALGLPPMKYGVAAYSIVRDSEAEAKQELDRITDVKASAAGYDNYQQWLAGTQLEQELSLQDYSVTNRGLRTGLVGTPAKIQDLIGEFEKVGVDFFLLQSSPQLEEMERFSDSVIKAFNPQQPSPANIG
ncbi:LLM class flavin-dependent oxidoreductase [Pontibacter toksunensis]|uniref:LLM class flavin-dependent oxidoreductase n=1 Tax=Pontibacter toksunensis TaxID=1332631 RepID=A0ABW6C205_9BACT